MHFRFSRLFRGFGHLLYITMVLACAPALFAQSATPITYSPQAFSTYRAMEAQAVPTSPTVITTSTLIWVAGWISCSSTQTITMTDGNGKNILPAISQTAPAFWALNVLAGSYISGGFSISASGAGCLYHGTWRI